MAPDFPIRGARDNRAMKLRMARNSLFAILLRSPWWISAAIALAFVLVALGAAPRQWAPVVVAGGLPFAAIAVVALVRQWRLPTQAQAHQILDRAATMAWPDFARVLRTGLERQGQSVADCRAAGADFITQRAGKRTVVAARRWKAARHGEEALRQLRNAAREAEAGSCVYVAIGDLTPQAERLARDEGIEVLRGQALASVLRSGLA